MKERCSFCRTKTQCPSVVSWLQPDHWGNILSGLFIVVQRCIVVWRRVVCNCRCASLVMALLGSVTFTEVVLLWAAVSFYSCSIFTLSLLQQRVCEVMSCACVTFKPPQWPSGSHTGVFRLKSFISHLIVMWMKICVSVLLLVPLVFAYGVILFF